MTGLFELKKIIKTSLSEDEVIKSYIIVYDLQENLYTVLSCNFYYVDTSKEQFLTFEQQTIELMRDFEAQTRNWFTIVNDAINAHDQDFQSF